VTIADYSFKGRTIIFRWAQIMLIIALKLSCLWCFKFCYCLITVIVFYSLHNVWGSCCVSLPLGDCRLRLLLQSLLGLIWECFGLCTTFQRITFSLFLGTTLLFSSLFFQSNKPMKISSPKPALRAYSCYACALLTFFYWMVTHSIVLS
jgi:hypothetical protein